MCIKTFPGYITCVIRKILYGIRPGRTLITLVKSKPIHIIFIKIFYDMFKHFYESLCNEKYSEMNRNCSNYSLGTNKFLQGCCSNVHAFFAWALEL